MKLGGFIHVQPFMVQFLFLMMRLWLHMSSFLREEVNIRMMRDLCQRQYCLLLTTFVTMKAQITVFLSLLLLLSTTADHLFFLSWGSNCFHGYFIALFLPCCMVSADGYFSWLYCQCIIALGASTLVPLYLMAKCFKQLQLGCCIFLFS